MAQKCCSQKKCFVPAGKNMKHYVANSLFTVKGESMSAGRLYDKIGDKAKGKVVFVVDEGVVCRITTTGIDDTTDNENVSES